VCMPLLIPPCTIKSKSSLLAPAQPGSPGKRAVKQLWWLPIQFMNWTGLCLSISQWPGGVMVITLDLRLNGFVLSEFRLKDDSVYMLGTGCGMHIGNTIYRQFNTRHSALR